MKTPVFIWPFVLAVAATRETVFEARELSETSSIFASIYSNVPADILWNATEKPIFTIRITDNRFGEEYNDQLDVTFESNSSHVILNVAESFIYKAAVVTGAGSRAILNASQIIILVWLSAVTGNWRHIFIVSTVILVSFVANALAQTFAQAQYDDRRKLVIHILAPRRFHFSNISLVSLDGSIRYKGVDDTSNVECSTSIVEDEGQGCLKCCFGRGLCKDNVCYCDNGYEPLSSCQLKERVDVFYNHPLDPRLLYTNLSNSDEVYFYYILIPGSGTIKPRMAVRTMSTNETFLIEFDRYGRLRRINQNKDDNGVQLQMLISRNCHVRIYSKTPNGRKRLMRRKNICDDIYRETAKQKIVPYIETLRRLHNKGGKNQENSSFYDKYMNLSIKARSCGMDKAIKSASIYLETSKDLYHLHESIQVPVIQNDDGGFFFTLPNITSKFDHYYENKCEATTELVQNICSSHIIRSNENMCSGFIQSDLDSAPGRRKRSIESFQDKCSNVIKSIKSFCDLYTLTPMGNKNSCIIKYDKTSNFFESDELLLKPVVTLDSGKVIYGFQERISLRNLSLVGPQNIFIEDDKPEFMINGITVIPKDPQPQDLYQVRLDYECATNFTLIDMRVKGSDLYTNYEVCSGTNSCHCCILYAAGARGSVVDEIAINITDSWAGTNLFRKVIVVF